MAGAPRVAVTRSDTREPRRPPTVPAPVSGQIAVLQCAARTSVAINQNPEVNRGPIADVWRNSSVAVAAGARI